MNKCIQKGLTAQAVRQAMEQHDGLVHAFIQRQGGGDISYEEALQAGRIGLWRAIQGYDPRRGTAFSTYACSSAPSARKGEIAHGHEEPCEY